MPATETPSFSSDENGSNKDDASVYRKNSFPIIFMTAEFLSHGPFSPNGKIGNDLEIKDIENNNNNNNNNKMGIFSKDKPKERDKWGKEIEFLLSCISLSIGLGNVWRFPFTALENGGGAFVIPYLIVLLLVGRPIYYLEMLIGQFSSRGCVKVYDLSPAMRGIGYGQTFSTFIVMTYYASLMALTIRYMLASFQSTLPWSRCHDKWNATCVDSELQFSSQNSTSFLNPQSSAELYFTKEILHETDSIDSGIGLPDWKLVLCLAFAWLCITLTLIKGIRSSGKVAYFLAVFPYFVMFILLIRSCTLPGAGAGILYFLKPQWDRILEAKVWYAAVTQVFFSLAICFGSVIMYSSYNRFSHNIYRDVTIVSILDTGTSMLAGCIVFGVIGHLAHIMNEPNINSVIRGGTGLAFITYPDAISKFGVIPQFFSVLFFLMLFVLGIGTNMGMCSTIMTVIKDQFPHLKDSYLAVSIASIGFSIGVIYTTPGGQFVLELLDFYGASFVALLLAVFEVTTFAWIYGVDRLCKDIEFMLGIKTGLYWRICWRYITPSMLIAILIYHIVEYQPITYNGYVYPDSYYALGWCLFTIAILQLPAWAIYAILQRKDRKLSARIINAFKPADSWGPDEKNINIEYQEFIIKSDQNLSQEEEGGFLRKIVQNIF